MQSLPLAIFLMGPTASGKTDLAVRLVEDLPCDIISVDSVMVYRGMDIGTAKPDAVTLAKAPHRLIDIRDPVEVYSAAEFRQDALREMQAVNSAGRIPLLVGGTMLYFKALESGLADLPGADIGIRARLEQEAEINGLEYLHRRLSSIDPQAARRIHPNDPQRIQRALEVYEITGRPISELQISTGMESLPFRVVKLVIARSDKNDLRSRIRRRFESMLEQGLVAEVEKLYQRGDLNSDLPSIRAVGYRQIWRYLENEIDYSAMTEQGITATRQFAKRQMTWLRPVTEAGWFDAADGDLHGKVLKYLQENYIS